MFGQIITIVVPNYNISYQNLKELDVRFYKPHLMSFTDLKYRWLKNNQVKGN